MLSTDEQQQDVIILKPWYLSTVLICGSPYRGSLAHLFLRGRAVATPQSRLSLVIGISAPYQTL